MLEALIGDILRSQVLVTVVIAGLSAQLLKIILFIFVHDQKFVWNDIFVTGGMPSAHSSLVWSLALGVFFTEGISNLFVFSVVLLAIVLRDAMGVRRTAGEEGHIIHQIIKKTKLKVKEFHYSMGHTPLQVIVGSIIGIAVAIIVNIWY